MDTVPLTEDTTYKVELVVQPNFATGPSTGTYQSRGLAYPLNDTLSAGAALCYGLAVVTLPEIPGALCEDTLIVWEAFRVETEAIWAPTLNAGYTRASGIPAGIEGSQYYFWSVGGSPLDVIGINPDPERFKVDSRLQTPNSSSTTAGLLSARGQINKANFPVEIWTPDPTRNDNSRYFGRIIGGGVTPPVLSFGNQSTTPLVDEHGIGVLALHGKIYFTSADQLGMGANPGQATLQQASSGGRYVQAAYGRFFRVHCRQRRVKHPYTIDMIFKQFLQPSMPPVVGSQPGAVQEVTMEQSDGPLPPTLEGAVGYARSTKFAIQNGELIWTDDNSPYTIPDLVVGGEVGPITDRDDEKNPPPTPNPRPPDDDL